MSSALKHGRPTIQTLSEFALQRLDAICEAIGTSDSEQMSARATLDFVSDGWGTAPVAGSPPWPNDLTDDGTPFEFSLGFETDKPDLRLLFESQLDAGSSTQSSWQAGLDMQAKLSARFGCDCSLFERIAAPFAPPGNGAPRFSLWHALVLGDNGPSLVKAYLNPEVYGAERAHALTSQALTRLGLPDAWRFTESRLTAGDTRLPYMSVDLRAPKAARVKLYLSASSADGVARLVRGSSNVLVDDALSWLERLTESSGPYTARPILVCHGFRRDGGPPEATVHVPIRCYAPSDEEALRRTSALLSPPNREHLTRAMHALAKAPLSRSKGVLSYVSLRMVETRVRVTTYLAPGAYTSTSEPDSATIPRGLPL